MSGGQATASTKTAKTLRYRSSMRSLSASYVATSTDFTAFVSAPARRHFMRGNRVGPEEEALAVVNG